MHGLGRYRLGGGKNGECFKADIFTHVVHMRTRVAVPLPFNMQIPCSSTVGNPTSAFISHNHDSRVAKLSVTGGIIPLKSLFDGLVFEDLVEVLTSGSELKILDKLASEELFHFTACEPHDFYE